MEWIYYAGTAIVSAVGFGVYIQKIVKRELRKSLPENIQAAQRLFAGKNVRLNLIVHKDGKVDYENFEVLKDIEFEEAEDK